jgi:GNAT superfamily N-acetyltransferase
MMLKSFTDRDQREVGHVTRLADCGVADTFPAFAEQLNADGFGFRCQRMSAGLRDGPVLVAVEDRRVVGAIGPMATMADPIGTRHQPPQYYAVHPDYRGRGHGRALWRAAMAWGRQHGAQYKILQASIGRPAERLYIAEGVAVACPMTDKSAPCRPPTWAGLIGWQMINVLVVIQADPWSCSTGILPVNPARSRLR